MVKGFLFLIVFFASNVYSGVFNPSEIQSLKKHFLSNFKANGAIVASPSKQNPNYYYDWIRDSAMAMGLVEDWFEFDHQNDHKKILIQYVSWSEQIQQLVDPLPDQDILGEPKFHVDGKPFTESWGRPQNDGPALRALVLIRFAHQLLKQHDTDYVKKHLYNANLDPNTMGVIKKDLEYVAHHWQHANFDLWEEIYGHHFFTTIVQQKALIEGALLAQELNDQAACDFYIKQALLLNQQLKKHADQGNQLITATLAPHPGPQKKLELDTSVVLAILMHPKNDVLSINHSYVQHTIDALHHEFNEAFPINNNAPGAILFGRYPGDTYDGYQSGGQGNPWFILTATMAEYYYTLAGQLKAGEFNKPLFNKYLRLGDNYLRLVKKYSPNLIVDEQINLHNGKQQGASSLTWSYVAILRAVALREQL